GVESIALRVERIAGIFHEDDMVRIPEAAVVESAVSDVAEIEERERTAVAGEFQTEDGAKSAKSGGFGKGVGIAGRVKDEFGEVRTGPELPVFRTFERSATSSFSECIGAEWCKAIHGRVMDRDPIGLESQTVCMKVFLVL